MIGENSLISYLCPLNHSKAEKNQFISGSTTLFKTNKIFLLKIITSNLQSRKIIKYETLISFSHTTTQNDKNDEAFREIFINKIGSLNFH